MQKRRFNKFHRAIAFALLVTTLLCGGTTMSVFADDGNSGSSISTTRKNLADILDMANAISYDEYLVRYESVKRGEETVVVYDANDAANNDYTSETEAVKVQEYGGALALYTPGDGSVSWTVNVSERAKYTVVIEYYPIANKSTDIERIFKLAAGDEDPSIPFAEARYLSLPKYWTNNYANAVIELENGQNADSIVNEATGLGLVATSYSNTNKKGKDVTCVSIEYPDVWSEGVSAFVDKYGFRFFDCDYDGNEIKPGAVSGKDVIWKTVVLHDSNTLYSGPFEFVFEKGENTILLESENEPMVIKSIKLVPAEDEITYKEYLEKYKDAPSGSDAIKIEAEYMYAFSSSLLYPLEDRTSAANSPSKTDSTVLNAVGGEKWQTTGQWMQYTFSVNNTGLYNIYSRFKQNTSDGMFVSRALTVYVLISKEDYQKLYNTDEGYYEGRYMTQEEYIELFGNDDGFYNGTPFAEAASLQFNYNSDWQASKLNDGSQDFKFYFKSGVSYVLQFDVTLGAMGYYINQVNAILDSINADYLEIVKLTSTDPDENIDYGFTRLLPDVVEDLVKQGIAIREISKEIAAVTGTKGSLTATLDKVADTILRMGNDPEREIARNLSAMKTEIGNLGTWLNDATLQPLMFDFITIQNDSTAAPKAKAGFFESIWYEICSFFASFFRNYDRVGVMEAETNEERVDVWLALGRDQSQIMRELINNDFTPNTKDSDGNNIGVNLRLVTEATLLPSVLSGAGPDVYIGLVQSNVINYAIRGALLDIDNMEDFYDIALNPETTEFNEAAMIVLGFEGKYYGLPTTMEFPMMFVREDVIGAYNIEIPETWDDLITAGVQLSGLNMEIGLLNDYRLFLYQNGGELFADDGMRINLDSNVALKSFNDMCNMFTEYKYSYNYSFANRFRSGEMPIGIQPYVTTYNQLKVFATEIDGKWGMYPVPGIATGEYDENGNEIIDHSSVTTVTATVIVAGCDDKDDAWEFLKWQTGSTAQSQYAEKMVSVLGDSGKQATANLVALQSLTWTTAEYAEIQYQVNNLASIPNYPGYYIVDRYTNFAFLAAYNNNADPVTELRSYITSINKEITRKRKEFGLEVLEFNGETVENLALKRRLQVEYLLNEGEVIHVIPQENSNDTEYIELKYTLSDAVKNKYSEEIARILKAVKEDNIEDERLNSEILEDLYEILPDLQKMADDTTFGQEDQKACDALLEFINGNEAKGIKGAIQWYENYKLYE